MPEKLTEKRIQVVAAPARGRLELRDASIVGLAFRVTPNNARSWYYFYRFNGRPQKVQLGKYPALSLADARDVARLKAADVAKGINPSEVKRRKKQEGKVDAANTFKKVAESFIEKYAKPKTKSWRKCESDLKSHVTPKWGTLPIRSIGRPDAARLIDHIDANSGPHMARLVRAYLHKLFSWAEERGIVDDNPIRRTANPARHVSKARERKLTPDELRKVIVACVSTPYPYGPLFQIMIYTAQRKGEVQHMRWNDVDLERGYWTLTAEQTKAKRRHLVHLVPQVVTILKALPRFTGEFVFTSADGTKAVDGFGAAKKALDGASGVSDWRLHDIRRTVASMMRRDLSIPIQTISEVLNHQIVGVTAKAYAHEPDEAAKARAWREWAAQVDAIASGDSHGNIIAFAR